MVPQSAKAERHAGDDGTTVRPEAHRYSIRIAAPHGTGALCSARHGRPLLHSLIDGRHTSVKVGCRGGGCGVCRIRVQDGPFRLLPMNRNRISAQEEADGILLACRVIPEGDMAIEALPLRPPAAAGRPAP